MIHPRDLPPSVIAAAEVLLEAIDATGALPVPETPIEERAKAVAFVVTAMFDPSAEIEVRDRTDFEPGGIVMAIGSDNVARLVAPYEEDALVRDAMRYAAQLVASGHCPIHLVKNCECLSGR